MARTKSFTHSSGDTGEHPRTVPAAHEPSMAEFTALNRSGSAPAFIVSTALKDAKDLAKEGRLLGAEEPGIAMSHYDDAAAVMDVAMAEAAKILNPSEKKNAIIEVKSAKTAVLIEQAKLYREVGFESEAKAKEGEAETERREVRGIQVYGLTRS